MFPQTKDLWGHETQQTNYDIYRPKYPSRYFDIILSKISPSKRINYLDLATGTGALLFPLSKHFSSISLGIDKSAKQIETAQSKLDATSTTIQLKVMDIKDLTPFMEASNLLKFDLITIGEALHWFDVPLALKLMKNEWLKEDGLLSIMGYLCQGFEYNVKNEEKAKAKELGYQRYKEWIGVVGPYFECDREELATGYDSYPFGEYFKVKEKEEDLMKIDITPFELIKMLKTFSGYNTYYEQKSKEKDFVDATDKLEKQIKNDLVGLGEENFIIGEKPLKLVHYFFIINLRN